MDAEGSGAQLTFDGPASLRGSVPDGAANVPAEQGPKEPPCSRQDAASRSRSGPYPPRRCSNDRACRPETRGRAAQSARCTVCSSCPDLASYRKLWV